MRGRPFSDAGGGRTGEGRPTHAMLVEQFNSTGDLVDSLLHGPKTVLDLVPARVAAIHLDGVTSLIGDAPDVAGIEQVVALLRSTRRRLPIASDSLVTDHPRIARFLPGFAGLLIVPIDGSRGFLAWFRPEIAPAEGRSDRSAPASAITPGRAEPWDGLAAAAARFSRDLDGAILRNLHADLARFGFHDALTGLSNTRLLTDRIEHALDGPSRGAGSVLLFVDFDSFNDINGSLGHDRGDEVLIQAAERLRSVTRASDTVARLAGDEFVILAGGADRVAASRIAERVSAALGRPFTLAGGPIRTTVSIGVAEAEAGDVGADLLRRAYTAMNWAKDFGRTDQAAAGPSQPRSRTAFMTGERVEAW